VVAEVERPARRARPIVTPSWTAVGRLARRAPAHL